MENEEMKEKWNDKRDFNVPICVWLAGGNVGG